MKLSDIKIKNAKPKAKDYSLSDGYNLHLLIKPNNSKLWKFIYQSPETGKRIKLSLGKYPFKTLTEAREEARNYYKLLSDGICPKTHLEQQAQKAEEENEALRSFAYKWIEWKKQRAETKKPLNSKTIAKTIQRLENHLFPRFEGVRLADITLKNVVHALEEPYKKTPDTIYRIARNLVEIMDYAAILERVPLNPLHSLKKYSILLKQ